MRGLRRSEVRVEPYDPEWATLGEALCERIAAAIDGLAVDVQHVGSTAVPGLASKPIIDITVGIPSMARMDALLKQMVSTGFVDRGDRLNEGDHLFIEEPEPEMRSAHIHVVEHDGQKWRQYIGFRDRLRQDGAVRRQYEELKTQLVKKFANDRTGYTAAKEEFIGGILGRLDD